ncbi:MAG: hypothetical protein AAGG44_11735 [Planctomycetota bacterium]
MVKRSIWIGLAIIGLLGSRASAEELNDQRYEELVAELTPDAEALWRQIPWKTSLLQAQQEAAASRKPIFIWAMDGHPLGCT